MGIISQYLQNQANLNLARVQFEREKQLIKEQNEYNSPKAQMDRFREAGLNTALMYSQGSSGLQTSHAQYNPPMMKYEFDVDNVANILSKFQDIKIKKAQERNITEEIIRKRMENEVYNDTIQWQKWLVEERLKLMQSQKLTNREKTRQLDIMNMLNETLSMSGGNYLLKERKAEIAKTSLDAENAFMRNQMNKINLDLMEKLRGLPAGSILSGIFSLLRTVM